MKFPAPYHHFKLNLDYNPLGRVDFGVIQSDWTGTGFSSMRRLFCYSLVLVLRGEGLYRDTEGRCFPLEEGDLFITSPNIPHQFGPPEGKLWTELALGFHGSLFDLWDRAGNLHPQAGPIKLKPLHVWYKRFCRLLKPTRLEKLQPNRHLIRILSLLEDLPLNQPYKQLLQTPEWMGVALSMIEAADPAKPYTIEQIAQSCGMGVHAFRRNFARLAGQGPRTYFQKVRMEKAHRLLASEDISVKQIAEQLGFNSAFHFSAAFKKYFNLSPSQFRASRCGYGKSSRRGRL